MAGVAQGEMTVFRRELADVGVVLTAEITALADHHRFLDTWFDNLFSDISVQRRINDARASTTQATQQLQATLAGVEQRRAAVADQADQLATQRLRILEPA